MTTKNDESAWGLAIETSSVLGAVALGKGDNVIDSRSLSGPRIHARDFVPMLAELCQSLRTAPEEIREVYVSSGPGSFTGLRIGMTVARMLGLAAGARVVAVPTLDVIAQNALEATPRPDRVAVILDAKRGNVYTAEFARADDLFTIRRGPVEADPAKFLAESEASGNCAVLGEGVAYHQEAVARSGLQILPATLNAPRPEIVFKLGKAKARSGQFDNWRTLTPMYIRPPEAEEKWASRQREAEQRATERA